MPYAFPGRGRTCRRPAPEGPSCSHALLSPPQRISTTRESELGKEFLLGLSVNLNVKLAFGQLEGGWLILDWL